MAGALGNETPPAAIASLTVQQCSVGDLGPALGTMLSRLYPHIFQVPHTRRCMKSILYILYLVHLSQQ